MYPHEGEGVIAEELADESTETGDRRMRAFILRQLLTMPKKKKKSDTPRIKRNLHFQYL